MPGGDLHTAEHVHNVRYAAENNGAFQQNRRRLDRGTEPEGQSPKGTAVMSSICRRIPWIGSFQSS